METPKMPLRPVTEFVMPELSYKSLDGELEWKKQGCVLLFTCSSSKLKLLKILLHFGSSVIQGDRGREFIMEHCKDKRYK